MALSVSPREIVRRGEYQLLNKAKHWERVLLADVANVQNGFPFKSEFFDRENGMPLIRIRDVNNTKTEHRYKGDYDSAFIVQRGELIIGMDGDFKAARWQGPDALLNQRVCRLTLRTELIDHKFFFMCLQPYLDAINAETSSVTVKHLSSRSIEDIPLPFPPLQEQHRIVAKIEELFSELDAATESLTRARAQLKTYRQALLKAAFEGKLTADWRAANPDKIEPPESLLARIRAEREASYAQALKDWECALADWQAEGQVKLRPQKPTQPRFISCPLKPKVEKVRIPSEWTWIPLANAARIGTGATPAKSRNDYYSPSEIPWITSGALNNEIVTEPTSLVSRRALEETNLTIYTVGTLLMAMYGEGKTRGKCSELGIYAATNQAIAAIDLGQQKTLMRSFTKLFLQMKYEELRMRSSGGVQPNLNLGIVSAIPVPLCSTSEQLVLVDALESRLSQIAQMEIEIDIGLVKITALRQSILKKAFSGQLVAQDPADEPASLLLARLRDEDTPAPKTRRKKRA